MELEKKISRNPNFIFRIIVDDAILVPIRKNVADLDALFTLNELGAIIWQELEEPQTFEALMDKILDEYDIDPDTLRQDLLSYLEDMLRIDALRMV